MSFDGISLRRATIDDAPALAIVGAGTLLEAIAGLVDGKSLVIHCGKNHSVESYVEYLQRPDTLIWLAVVQPGGAPVGYIMLTTPDLPLDGISDADLEVKRIYLFARFQGTGGGKLLLNQAISTAQEAGKSRLLLGVHAENKLALDFYYRNGFVKVGARKFQVGPTLCDDFVLAKQL